MTGKLTHAGRPYASKKVFAQVNIKGFWYDIGKQWTDKRGSFSWVFKPDVGLWRYRFDGDNKTKPATSPTFRTPRPGGVTDRVDPNSL